MLRKPLLVVFLATLVLTAQTPVPQTRPTIEAVRSRIRHVFVLVQENHSFDNYFGTFPGAENLASAQAQSHGFRQYDPIGKAWVTPFRMTDPDIEAPSQARLLVYDKMNGGKMDAFVSAQETASLKKFAQYPEGARDVGLVTMGYYDCDTIPFLWKYAKSFALFDHVFSGMVASSTPNNIELIAAQAGQSQMARNPKDVTGPKDDGPGVPVVNNLDPAYGPYTDDVTPVKQISQSYATLMLTLSGSGASGITADADGIVRDRDAVAKLGHPGIPWGWYQEGYISPTQAQPGYEIHHNAPQYFGYIRNNTELWNNVHGVRALLDNLQNGALPAQGIFYVKGTSQTEFGWKPANKDPYVQANYRGDDDHPGAGDADHQVGEAFVATFINAIARSKYWNDSAIILTWDDPGGFYDHVPPPQFEQCPDAHPCGDGQRLPFMVLSPYARSGAIVSDAGDITSIVKFATELFDLPALASLPDEKASMPEGPRDTNPAITDLLGAFDPDRLNGTKPTIPATDAQIPDSTVNAIPPPMNCRSLGIQPVTLPNAPSTPPPGFAPRSPVHPKG